MNEGIITKIRIIESNGKPEGFLTIRLDRNITIDNEEYNICIANKEAYLIKTDTEYNPTLKSEILF